MEIKEEQAVDIEHLIKIRDSNIIINSTKHKFSVPQIEYSLGGSSKKGSHVYFPLQVFWVILLFDIYATMVTWCRNSIIWRHNSSTMTTINRK